MALAIRTLHDVYLRDLEKSEDTANIVKSCRAILWAAQRVRRKPFDGRLRRNLELVKERQN